MTQNLTQPSTYEDQIDLREIFKILIESKKLIISTILIFTIASIIYSFSLNPLFKSSTNLEVGYVDLDNGDIELIESTSDLMSHLNVLLIKNPDNRFNQNLSMNSIEGKIISLETTSSSAEQNENLLTEVANYIKERHSSLAVLITDQKKDEISHKIEIIESEISLYKSQNLLNLANIEAEISFLKEVKRFDLEAQISKLKVNLPLIDQEISQLKQVIIEDSANLNLLKNTTFSLERAANSPTLEQIISSYKSKIFQLARERNNNISDISSLSQELDALKKNTLQSDDLLELEKRKKDSENYASQSDKLFSLEQRQKTLENQLLMLTSQPQIKTQLIRNIETKTIKPKTQVIISLGLIFGFITGIFLVFINNFIKSYKEH